MHELMLCAIRTNSDILLLFAPHFLNLFQSALLLKYMCQMDDMSLHAGHNFSPFRASCCLEVMSFQINYKRPVFLCHELRQRRVLCRYQDLSVFILPGPRSRVGKHKIC